MTVLPPTTYGNILARCSLAASTPRRWHYAQPESDSRLARMITGRLAQELGGNVASSPPGDLGREHVRPVPCGNCSEGSLAAC
jgi:hypothetical protein